jgi:hypothetical protein
MNNQNGGATLPYIIFSIFFFLISLIFINKKLNFLNKNKASHQLYLCNKKINGEVQTFINNIERANMVIRIADKGSYLTYLAALFPGMALVGINAKRAISLAKSYQAIQLFSYMKKIKTSYAKNCRYSINLIKTPYRLQATGFIRDNEQMTILRDKKWRILFFNTQKDVLTSNFSIHRTLTQTEVKTKVSSL